MAQLIEVPGMGVVEFPDGMSDDQIASAIKANMPQPAKQEASPRDFRLQGEGWDRVKNYSGRDAIGGGIRGAGSIGASVMRVLPNSLGGDTKEENKQRRTEMDSGLASLIGSNPESTAYKTTKLMAEAAGTWGAGGALAKTLGSIPGVSAATPALLESVKTGGMAVNGMKGLPGLLTRATGGAITGGLTAGAIDPESAKTGAMIGGAFPISVKLAGDTGRAIKSAITGGGVTPEVAALARRAQELGIKIPADRLVDSKPLNAVASSLNYVPLSGRAATEDAMVSQLNRNLSKTFGEDSSNVTMALRKAGPKLGGEFDRVLKANTVRVDQQFMQDLAESANRASRELGADGAAIIGRQVDDILAKAATGEIDGQAAYNIKRTLDRINKHNSPEAFHAGDLKKGLMGALNRSLGPEEAARFASTRQQYGNMLDLQKLAKNGAEGEVSVARIANMRNIKNPQMQELADIAAQFVKSREGQHGAAQRVVMGMGAGMAGYAGGGLLGGGAGIAGAALAGRGMNSLLNSNAARNYLLSPAAAIGQVQPIGLLTEGVRKTAPLLMGQP